jgi:glycosyltransferase involved in cell wall biosynthesis
MSQLVFHVPAIPHTRPTSEFSHCAYTTKVRLFGKVLREAFPDACVIYYGVGTDLPDGYHACDSVMSPAEWETFFPPRAPEVFVGEGRAHVDHPGYVAFNATLAQHWLAAMAEMYPGNRHIFCLPFGIAHKAAWDIVAPVARARGNAMAIETGIGYPDPFLDCRIYESAAWMHYVAGRSGCEGSDYHAVVPHYYDPAEWPVSLFGDPTPTEQRPIVFMGRLGERKGLHVVKAIAEAMPDRDFVLYGQGDPSPWVGHGGNVRYGGVLHGRERAIVLESAAALLCPSRYIEPFGQVHIEAQLMGTPVVCSAHGVYRDYQGRPGVGLATDLPSWVAQTKAATAIWPPTRVAIASAARRDFGIEAVAQLYRKAMLPMFRLMSPRGWYGEYHPDHTLPPVPEFA